MPENILFDAEFNPADFIKGFDSMIERTKQLNEKEKELATTLENTTVAMQQKDEKIKAQQILLDNLRASNNRLKESYEGVGNAAEGVQKVVGKPLSIALDTSQALPKVKQLTDSIETLRAKMLARQEFLIKETDVAKVAKYNKEIETLQSQIVKLANAGRKGFDDLGNKIKQQTGLMETLTNRVKLYEQALTKANSNTAIAGLNKKIEQTKNEITALSNSGKTGFDKFGNSLEVAAGKTNVLNKSFSFLRTTAMILPGIGLAGLFGLIGTAVFELGENIFATKEKLDRFVLSQKDLNDALASSEYSKAIESVNLLKTDIQLAKEGILDKTRVLKEYNETIGKTTGQVKSLAEAEKALARNADAYVLMTLYKAAAEIAAGEGAKKLVEAEGIRLKQEKDFANAFADSRVAQQGTFNAQDYDAETKRIEEARRKRQQKQVDAAKAGAQAQLDIAANFRRYAANIANGYDFNLFGDTKEKKDKVAPENVYKQKLLELKAKLAAINQSVFTSDDTIRQKVAAEVAKGNEEYDRLLKEKKLTTPEARSLKALNSIVGQAEINKELKEFNQKRKDAQKRIDDELEKLRAEDVEKRVANIKGEFEQETAAIQLEYEKQRTALQKQKRDAIKSLEKENRLGLISDDALRDGTSNLQEAYGKLFADLDIYVARKQAELSQKSFNRSVDGITEIFEGTQVLNSEGATAKTKEITTSYLKREISYKEFQRRITEALSKESKRRIELSLLEKKSQLDSVNARILAPQEGDDKEFKKSLLKRQRALRQQISDLERQGQTGDAADKKAKDDADLARLQDYITAYTDIVAPILQIWQQATEAEAKALDRSLAIQQRRVDQAQRIADRGNATYLKMEEDKMQDLRVKQEANAKRQIQVNAAIQASSALTAVISGVAKAVITGNPLDAIAAVGAIIAAIGAGYAIVNSLQQNQVSFFDGTEDTGRGGKVDSKGGFHAILHPNERVVTAEQNKKLKGISNEELIQLVDRSKVLVEQYRTPVLPDVNYDRLEHASNFHITHDDRLAAAMSEMSARQEDSLNEMRRFNKNIRDIRNEVNIDRNGIKVLLMAAHEDARINKRV